jgi:hypothetical protein
MGNNKAYSEKSDNENLIRPQIMPKDIAKGRAKRRFFWPVGLGGLFVEAL